MAITKTILVIKMRVWLGLVLSIQIGLPQLRQKSRFLTLIVFLLLLLQQRNFMAAFFYQGVVCMNLQQWKCITSSLVNP